MSNPAPADTREKTSLRSPFTLDKDIQPFHLQSLPLVSVTSRRVSRWRTGSGTRSSWRRRTRPAASASAVSPSEDSPWTSRTARSPGSITCCSVLTAVLQGKVAIVIDRPLRCDNCCLCPCMTQVGHIVHSRAVIKPLRSFTVCNFAKGRWKL